MFYSTIITQLPTSYNHVRLPSYKYLVGRGYGIFQKWTGLHSWFDQPYFTNHISCLVGFNECRFEASCCLEWCFTCTLMAFLFALWNWRDQQPWHHMYSFPSSSSPSIRTWDQLCGETLTGRSIHCKVQWINQVESFWNNNYNHWWKGVSLIEVTRQLWN